MTPKLSAVAREWSMKQAKAQRISHDGFMGDRNRVYQDMFGAVQFPLRRENVAMFSYGGFPETICRIVFHDVV